MNKLNITFPPTDSEKAAIGFEVSAGQHWYLSSDSGLFVTNLFEWLEGKKFLPHTLISLEENGHLHKGLLFVKKFIKTVRFSTNYGQTGEYYQQRYQATDNEDIIELRDFLDVENNAFMAKMLRLMGLDKLMQESLNMLSTGEYKKACIIKAALLNPQIMFIEDPNPGLDREGRALVNQLLSHIADEGTTIVTVGSGEKAPPFATHCMLIQQEKVIYSGIKKGFPTQNQIEVPAISFPIPEQRNRPFTHALKLVDVNVKYQDRLILDGVNWSVAKGEKWQLMGNNGAGKSLLLSLVYADNPQAYSNNISIFDRKRGTGETIWDIKESIGYYSSEMFRYFNKSLTVEKSLQTLIFHPYKKRILTSEEQQFQEDLLQLFDLSDKRQKTLHELSAANQRVAVLIGVLLKNAPLLILDEPCQHFDQQLTKKFLALIDKYAKDRTLIFVTHDPTELPVCINKRYLVEEGRGTDWIKKTMTSL
ncbi:ATP-binding cassette domain-containing protein [Flammeovirgaceae bacterium SG7u.111]|nr:ATP-binding cassette domain-containing protein [Flammeovirgaceae bacterium SG7u.132]WPO36976.1 ATP-binding cassette domain-containing protein [Flammeovirgaceae bacterium SG7u.111]